MAGCASSQDIPVPHFYDYWQRSPDGVGLMGIPTQSYREIFAADPHTLMGQTRDFRDAAFGDVAALHRFWHSPDRDDNGEYGEAWVADAVLLALVYRDEGTYQALRDEPDAIREAVGTAIEEEMPKERDSFARTRTLYKFRHTERPNHAMQPTSGRCTLQFSMTPTSSPATTRGLASGG